MIDIIVIGAGGHASVIIDCIELMIKQGENIQIKGILDDRKDKSEFMGYKVLDKIGNIYLYNDENTKFVIAIGDNKLRMNIANKFKNINYYTIIHPSSIIGKNVHIGYGSMVMANAVINSNTIIGNHVIINSGAIVEHDNIINDFVHISPSVTLCGGVKIGYMTHIGASVTIIPSINIGSESIVGAGSVVTKNIKSRTVNVGVPSKTIKDIL